MMFKKHFWYGSFSAFAGMGLGLFVSNALSKVFPFDTCPGDLEGMLMVYDCPWWHPISWIWSLPLVGWVAGPLVMNVVYKAKHKKDLFMLKKVFLITVVTGLTVILIFMLILNKIGLEISKYV